MRVGRKSRGLWARYIHIYTQTRVSLVNESRVGCRINPLNAEYEAYIIKLEGARARAREAKQAQVAHVATTLRDSGRVIYTDHSFQSSSISRRYIAAAAAAPESYT